MSEDILCGLGRERETKYGALLKLSFSERDIDTLRENLSNGWVNVAVKRRKNPADGKTHYCVIDLWRKQSDSEGRKDLPF